MILKRLARGLSQDLVLRSDSAIAHVGKLYVLNVTVSVMVDSSGIIGVTGDPALY